jgi:hypothetical protein
MTARVLGAGWVPGCLLFRRSTKPTFLSLSLSIQYTHLVFPPANSSPFPGCCACALSRLWRRLHLSALGHAALHFLPFVPARGPFVPARGHNYHVTSLPPFLPIWIIRKWRFTGPAPSLAQKTTKCSSSAHTCASTNQERPSHCSRQGPYCLQRANHRPPPDWFPPVATR